MLQIKYYPNEGYNFQYMPDYRFYSDEKLQRPDNPLYYEYPYKTRVWVPYKNLRLYYDYMPSRYPFGIQRSSRVHYFQPLRDILDRVELF